MIFLILLISLIFFIIFNFKRENFSESLKKKIVNHYPIKNNIKLMFVSFDGLYRFINNDNYVVLNNKPVSIKIKQPISCGTYNYNYNYLLLHNNSLIYKYCLYKNKLSEPIFFKTYFKDIDINNIDCLFFLSNIVYIFNKNTIIIYDLTNNKYIKKVKNTDLFEKIPNNIDCCFLNFNDPIKHEVLPYIYCLKDTQYYKYKFKNNKFKFITNGTYDLDTLNFKTESKKMLFKYKPGKIESSIINPGLYRIVIIGAGLENGGYGGVVFNDVTLNKDDNLLLKIGGSGDRIPVKEENDKSKLPYTGSCSGSGSTSIYKNKKLLMTAGGGGGWSSEIIKHPNQCNSLNYFKQKKCIGKLFIPIKQILIEGPIAEAPYKLVVTKFIIDVDNCEEINMDIYEHPTYDDLNLKDKHYKYETNYCSINKKSYIHILFDTVITDYKINIKCECLTSDKNINLKPNIIIFDEQYRKYPLYNFKNILTSETILNFLSKKNIPLLLNKSIERNNKRLFYLKGGFNGGISVISDKFNHMNNSGGGGGFKSGDSCILPLDFNYKDIDYPIDYVAGCGGSSYVYNNKFIRNKQLYELYKNDYNDKNGMIIMYRYFV